MMSFRIGSRFRLRWRIAGSRRNLPKARSSQGHSTEKRSERVERDNDASLLLTRLVPRRPAKLNSEMHFSLKVAVGAETSPIEIASRTALFPRDVLASITTASRKRLLVSASACKKKRSRLGGLAAGRSIVRMTPENG